MGTRALFRCVEVKLEILDRKMEMREKEVNTILAPVPKVCYNLQKNVENLAVDDTAHYNRSSPCFDVGSIKKVRKDCSYEFILSEYQRR